MPTKIAKIGFFAPLCIFAMMISSGDIHAFSLTPAGTISPNANEFLPYTASTTITITTGGQPVTYPIASWTSSGLPAGLSLSTSGANNENCTITGIPTDSGTNLSFTVTATDSKSPNPRSATQTYQITINPRCRFSGASTGSILFNSGGTIDPTFSGPINNSVVSQVFFQCGPGATYSFNPVTPQLTGAKNIIPFTLNSPQGLAALGLNTTDATLIPLLTTSSSIPQANYQNAYAETDTSGPITVTINWTGTAAGSMSATITASGTVINACSVSGVSTINFGSTLDASIAGPYQAVTTPPSIKCTMGDTVNVSDDHGVNKAGFQYRLRSGTNYINYNFSYATPVIGAGALGDIGGSGAGHLALSASIPAGALDNAPAGTYTDTITLTISY